MAVATGLSCIEQVERLAAGAGFSNPYPYNPGGPQ